jgi:transglutaminase-like putative cysteine protease
MSQGPSDLETQISSLQLLDHHGVDWERVQRTAYLIHQHLHYEYPGPIADLCQRLVIVPRDTHGDQRLIVHRLEVSALTMETTSSLDEFGNHVLELFIPQVENAIDFEAWIIVERHTAHGLHLTTADALTDPRYLEPSALTQPDDALRQAALMLQAEGWQGLALAERINTWVYQTMRYQHDITTIHTTAAQAFARRQGVCQDFAHVMLALCRLCHLPARYVSGHLLGEGGTHAWVEVLLPSTEQENAAVVLPFDPTHGCRTSLSYLTVAVGRDYYDVAPTSGTFRAPYRGELSARKRVGLTGLEYDDA